MKFFTMYPTISGRNGPRAANKTVQITAKIKSRLYGFKYETNRLKIEILIEAFSDMPANLPKFQGMINSEINSFKINCDNYDNL